MEDKGRYELVIFTSELFVHHGLRTIYSKSLIYSLLPSAMHSAYAITLFQSRLLFSVEYEELLKGQVLALSKLAPFAVVVRALEYEKNNQVSCNILREESKYAIQ